MLTSIGQHHSMCGVKSAGAEVHGTSRQLFHQDFTFMFAVYFLYSLLLCVVPYSCQALLMDRPLPASGFSWCLCCPGSDVAVILRPPPSFQDKKKKKSLLCTSLYFLQNLHINAKCQKLVWGSFFFEGGIKNVGVWILNWYYWPNLKFPDSRISYCEVCCFIWTYSFCTQCCPPEFSLHFPQK